MVIMLIFYVIKFLYSVLFLHSEDHNSGWPHSSQSEIPCVFPEFSLCYINFPCAIFMQKLRISTRNKDHITTVLLHTEVNQLIFKVWII